MRVRGLRLLGMMAMAAGFLVSGAADASAGIDQREARQRHRIRAGLDDGSLTRGEARRLVHQQVRIERAERRFRRNDGHLGPRERVTLNRQLGRASRRIYRARHNDRTR